MAAGLGFKDFTTGEVLTAADVDGYLMQNIWVFATATARDAAVTSPQEGNFAFTKDNNSLWYYDGAAWVASGATGDIEGVTAGIGISGGGTSGTVTVTNSMATAIDAKGDLVAGTGADTFAKLTVGANGTTLVANSSTATGLEWVGGAWTAFTPTWTGLTVGNGVYNQSHYSLVGKTATFAIDFSLGSTSAVTGAVTLTLPTVLARKNVYNTGTLYSFLADTGAGDVLVFPRVSTSDAKDYNVFFADDSAIGVTRSQLSSTTPFTWASTDRIIYSGTIEVA